MVRRPTVDELVGAVACCGLLPFVTQPFDTAVQAVLRCLPKGTHLPASVVDEKFIDLLFQEAFAQKHGSLLKKLAIDRHKAEERAQQAELRMERAARELARKQAEAAKVGAALSAAERHTAAAKQAAREAVMAVEACYDANPLLRAAAEAALAQQVAYTAMDAASVPVLAAEMASAVFAAALAAQPLQRAGGSGAGGGGSGGASGERPATQPEGGSSCQAAKLAGGSSGTAASAEAECTAPVVARVQEALGLKRGGRTAAAVSSMLAGFGGDAEAMVSWYLHRQAEASFQEVSTGPHQQKQPASSPPHAQSCELHNAFAALESLGDSEVCLSTDSCSGRKSSEGCPTQAGSSSSGSSSSSSRGAHGIRSPASSQGISSSGTSGQGGRGRGSTNKVRLSGARQGSGLNAPWVAPRPPSPPKLQDWVVAAEQRGGSSAPAKKQAGRQHRRGKERQAAGHSAVCAGRTAAAESSSMLSQPEDGGSVAAETSGGAQESSCSLPAAAAAAATPKASTLHTHSDTCGGVDGSGGSCSTSTGSPHAPPHPHLQQKQQVASPQPVPVGESSSQSTGSCLAQPAVPPLQPSSPATGVHVPATQSAAASVPQPTESSAAQASSSSSAGAPAVGSRPVSMMALLNWQGKLMAQQKRVVGRQRAIDAALQAASASGLSLSAVLPLLGHNRAQATTILRQTIDPSLDEDALDRWCSEHLSDPHDKHLTILHWPGGLETMEKALCAVERKQAVQSAQAGVDFEGVQHPRSPREEAGQAAGGDKMASCLSASPAILVSWTLAGQQLVCK
jgi:hypothetical protein